MGLKQSIFMLAGRLYFDKPAQKQTLAEHAEVLRRSGEDLAARLATAHGSRAETQQLRHVIGIERWGQQRLRVFLGEPFVAGGHGAHVPPEGARWDDLVREFASTRAGTVAIAEQIAAARPTRAVNHNQFGELTAHGWLRYLDGHARRELRNLK